MQSLALVIHVILAVSVVGLVLMQHGKGADAGAAFGSGASATVFGARGSASFLTRATTILATLFFITSLFLFYLAAHRDGTARSVTDVPGIVEEAPAVPDATDLPGGVTEGADTAGSAAGSDADMPEPAPPAPPTVEGAPASSD